MVYESPPSVIDNDWEPGKHQWREITPEVYQELFRSTVPLYQDEAGFMQSEPVDILATGEWLYVCCQKSKEQCRARLLPANGWFTRYQSLS
jgi:hypothetical protein